MDSEERGDSCVEGNEIVAEILKNNPNMTGDAFLAAIINTTQDAIVTKDLGLRITSWNPAAERMFGYRASEIVGQPITILIPPDRAQEEELIWQQLRAGRRVEHYETLRRRKDGTLVPVSLTISPLYDPAGQLVGASKIARDISARLQFESERRELLEREREAYEQARILLDLSAYLGSELDPEQVARKVVDSATLSTLAELGVFVRRPALDGEAELLHCAPANRTADALSWFEKLRETQRVAACLSGEYAVSTDAPGGSVGIMRSYLAMPLLSRSGPVLGGLFLGHSAAGAFTERNIRLVRGIASQAAISLDNALLYQERVRAENRERVARGEAERAARLRDEFLAIVSHELRTPVSGILGWTQLLRRGIPPGDSVQTEALNAIERGTRAQVRIIEDLLDMSKIASGKLRLDVQTVELVPIATAAIETILPAAEAKNIRIDRIMDPSAPPIKGDPSRLQQVLWNLLSNAVKFTPRGGKIQVHVERVNSHVEVSVSDTGCGISAQFLPFLFDRFSQADTSTTRHHGGLGLGLSVAKQLVELHGGKIFASSPGEGRGATFSFHLPVSVAQNAGGPREHPSASLGAGPVEMLSLPAMRVLVIDDDVDSCRMLSRILEQCGARVETVTSGAEGLERVREAAPDILLSDIGMPEMDGYALIQELRAKGYKFPAVAVTAFARSEDRVRALRAGYNMHLSKPVEPRELVAVLSSLAVPAGGTRSE